MRLILSDSFRFLGDYVDKFSSVNMKVTSFVSCFIKISKDIHWSRERKEYLSLSEHPYHFMTEVHSNSLSLFAASTNYDDPRKMGLVQWERSPILCAPLI